MAFLINFRLLRKAILLAATLGVCAAQTSDDANYSDMLQVTSSLNVYYKLTSTDSGSSALSVKAVYQGLAWLGIGVNPDGKMVGGNAVIGQPNEASSSVNPGKYTISGRNADGVVLMDSSAQTLIDGSITQDTSAGTTTLSFTKILNESGENAISESGQTTFIYAIGSDNTYPAYHGGGRGSFKVDLSGVNLAMVTPAPTLAPTASTELSSTTTGATTASPTSSMAPAPSARTGSLSLAPPTSSASPSPRGSPTMHSAIPANTDKRSTASPSPSGSSSWSPRPIALNSLTSPSTKASQIGAVTATVAPSVSQAPVSLAGLNALSPPVKVQDSKASPAPFKALDSSASPSPSGSSASPSPAGADVSISSGGYSGTDDMFSTPTENNGGRSSGSPSPRPISATVNRTPSQIKSSLFSLSVTKPSSSETNGGRYIGTEN